MKRALAVVAAIAAAFPLSAAEMVTLNGRAMGTTWVAKIQPSAAHVCDTDALRERIAAKLEALEQQLSTWRPHSDLSRFNATTHTEWFPVPVELAAVAAEALRIAALTDGAFDPTVAPLVRLWGFGPEGHNDKAPSPESIAAARARIDWRALEVRASPPALRRTRPGITADFSSTAKGFAADAVSALLAAEGAPRHLVQVGGDVRAGAATGGRRGWPVAIEQPHEETRGLAGVVSLAELAVSTSGNYRNFSEFGGTRHGHILDPRKGQPVDGELAAVSVVHASCATSSSLATGLFVLGAEKGLRLAREQKLACLFLVRRGSTLVRLASPEFERLEP